MFKKKQVKKSNGSVKITLPVCTKKELKNGTVEREYGEAEFFIDTSISAQFKFEQILPTLQGTALTDYMINVKENAEKNPNTATILAFIKGLYCFFDTDMKFVDFAKMFDIAEVAYCQKLLKEITLAFNIILDGEKQKN